MKPFLYNCLLVALVLLSVAMMATEVLADTKGPL